MKEKVTVIIPYKIDRGWLKDAIASVPNDVQLLVSQGPGNWPANFNKVWDQVEGDYIKYLHEDDMLTSDSIQLSIEAFKKNVDFIHGNAIELNQKTGESWLWKSSLELPTLETMLKKNTIHSATVMYRKSVFERVGLFDETLNTAEEFEFNLRCLKAGMQIGYVNAPLAIYRRHPAQKVRMVSVAAKDEEREMVRNKYR